MFKVLFALLILPAIGMLLLAGVIVESAKAQFPARAPGAAAVTAQAASPTASGFSLAASPAAPSGAGMGGPYEPVAADAGETDPGRWRISEDPRAERRFAPAARRPLNSITLRF